ncbi:MAG: hypothetical protein RQ756_00200 [Flavobacteriaceae bacterium]|nr:hypothetical protein [Flavobacteriaceae bacterium]
MRFFVWKTIIYSLVFICFYSCNRVLEKEMDNFIMVKVKDIIKEEASLGLTLIDSQDSLFIAQISKHDFDNFEDISSKIDTNNKLKIKGVIYEYQYPKYIKKSTIDRQNPKVSASIIAIKDLEFME